MDQKDTILRMIQFPKHTNTDHPEAIQQRYNRRKERKEHNKQITNHKKPHYNEIRSAQPETRETFPLLGHIDINQVKMFTSTN